MKRTSINQPTPTRSKVKTDHKTAMFTPMSTLFTRARQMLAVSFVALSCAAGILAEDGYRVWLRYEPLPEALAQAIRPRATYIVVPGKSETANATRAELVAGFSGLLGQPIAIAERVERDGAIVVGTPQTPLIAALKLSLTNLGNEGFVIRSAKLNGHAATVIAANSDLGALYGAFHFLRLLQTMPQTEKSIVKLNVSETPRLQVRMLNHWDNLNGTIERGYAGRSLWKWEELPGKVDERLKDYARINASIGINATALNNVNANAQSLSAEYLKKTAVIADVFRPYGVRVFLSARFSAPMELGGLKTADPFDPVVAAWWKKKADEIYALIPDFGGFLVKANSEGQPGPRTYNRNHVDGANMLARAVAPHHGIVIWRAFVYDMKDGYDRAAAAYDNLQPFDGKFAANVLLQVKNGPIDFQPREPFHPLFGAMPKTQVIPEFQITQEYLGQANNLAFLAPMWREVLDADTYAKGKGSTVTRVIDGSLYKQKLTGIAGVANTGSDRNWTGQDLTQSNWYAFGRLAWNPDLSSKQIADEWIRQTLTRDANAVATLTRILCESHEAVVDYMTPLGLHHIMWGGHHYGPAPWWDRERREDWNPPYFHRADETGLGFDRTAAGSNAVAQYYPPVRAVFTNLKTCPENLLVWFHHVPWDYRMKSGRIFWDELALHYQRGVDWVRAARRDWAALAGVIDAERHAAVAKKIELQERDAIVWREGCLLYFQTFSKRPLPGGVEKPAHTLNEYKAKSLLNW